MWNDTGYVSFGTLFETPLAKGLGGYAVDPDLALLLFAPAFGLALFGLPALRRRRPTEGPVSDLERVARTETSPGQRRRSSRR